MIEELILNEGSAPDDGTSYVKISVTEYEELVRFKEMFKANLYEGIQVAAELHDKLDKIKECVESDSYLEWHQRERLLEIIENESE